MERELRLILKLLKRKELWKITSLLLMLMLFWILIKISIPVYSKGRLVYKGLLSEFGYSEYINYASIVLITLQIATPIIIIIIILSTLKINGLITLTESKVIISTKKLLIEESLSEINRIKIQFNYFKKNDIEPRNIFKGNNNFFCYTKNGVNFKYEFLIQTKQEDEIFRKILNTWTEKGIEFDYKTSLNDF